MKWGGACERFLFGKGGGGGEFQTLCEKLLDGPNVKSGGPEIRKGRIRVGARGKKEIYTKHVREVKAETVFSSR